MALKLFQRLPAVLQFGPSRLLVVCPACVCTSSGRCILTQGCRRLWRSARSLTTIAKEPSFVAGSSAGLRRDSVPRFCLTLLHGPAAEEERAFCQLLSSCSSSGKVLKLVRSAEMMSDSMAAAVLHRVADLEREAHALRDPSVLEDDVIRALCFQLERDSRRLSDSGLLAALLAGTRLFLDPMSTLMVRLVTESQERLNRGGMSVGQLCTLGQAVHAMKGPVGSVMLEEVMEHIRKQEPSKWSLAELVAVYGLLGGGVARNRCYQDLLNAMHAHAVKVASSMDKVAVSGVLGSLMALNQTKVTPLVIALCKQAVRHVPHFSDEELAAVLAALMHYGLSDRYFVEAVERRAPSLAFTAHPETVTKVMQFFGLRNILSPQVLDAVAESFVYRADAYSTDQVALQIVPFGKLGYLPPNAAELFRKVEAVLQTRSSQFQPHMLIRLLHSCILVERFPVNFVAKVFSEFFLQQLQEEGSGIDYNIRAQLTQLDMTVKLECLFHQGPRLGPKYRVKSYQVAGSTIETPVNVHLCNSVKIDLMSLLGGVSYFGSQVLTPYCYTLDVELKLDDEGYVLPASHKDVCKRIAVCIDGQSRFTNNTRQLLGKETIKQRHLRLLGYEVVQIPFYEFEHLHGTARVDYLHEKIFSNSYRLSW
ncbi:FAST kinase domain-containing protein 3, mitochondrial [Nerophis lumbriciformis]|uniref:FAST kinase domain-containing protein 3, mitochondrial n=1 Tax=Nerophis lumbriciformis TaxID=546530 RepID=UPI003BA9D4DF